MKKVFIDLGANKGQSTNYALQKILNGVEDYEIHTFETLPLLAERLKEHFKKNPKVHVYHRAAWDENVILKFYVSPNSTESGTVFFGKTTGRLSKDVYIKVQAIDFSEWIVENLKEEDYNILKFDIEGAEYRLLDKLFLTDTYKYFNEVHGEFHTKKMTFGSEPEREAALRIEEKVKNHTTPYKYWDCSRYPGLVDYKQGTRPSLASSKILNYDKDGKPVMYNEPSEDE